MNININNETSTSTATATATGTGTGTATSHQHKHQQQPHPFASSMDAQQLIDAERYLDFRNIAVVDTCSRSPASTTSNNKQPWKRGEFFSFFFLHCRTSARHGRSTTGISMWLRSNFPVRKKPTTNPPKTSNKTSNTHTQAKARARQICQGNLQTKWNKVKHTRPSQPLKCSRPPCSTPPRSPIVRCQPYQYLHLDTQASLLRLASDVVAWVDTCPP